MQIPPVMAKRRSFFLSASLLTCAASAHAQDSEIALFYWAAFGGATLLLLGLIGWFLFAVIGKRDSQQGDGGQRVEQSKGKRLGE